MRSLGLLWLLATQTQLTQTQDNGECNALGGKPPVSGQIAQDAQMPPEFCFMFSLSLNLTLREAKAMVGYTATHSSQACDVLICYWKKMRASLVQ